MSGTKDQQLQQIIAKAIYSNQGDPIYLASGFFTELQKNNLTTFETLLTNQGKNFYSPRLHTIDFSTITDKGAKAAVIQEIFKSNVENIDKSKEAHFFLDTSYRGAYDMGTVWELGFAIGNYIKNKKELSGIQLHLANDGMDFVMTELKANLIEMYSFLQGQYKGESNKASLLLSKDNIVNAKDTIETLGYNMNPLNLNALLAGPEKIATQIQSHARTVFVIDNTPFTLTALMGLMYAVGIDYRTASVQGYGSNVMIAASSKGHIQLPGFYNELLANKTID